MRKLYCFDFDGTLTYKDTMFLYLKSYNSGKFYVNFIKHIPLFILMKMKLMNTEKVKKSFISSILKGEKKNKLEESAQLFLNNYYPHLIRKNALDFISNIDHSKTESLLVTASLDIWAKPFADKFNMKLVSTKAEFVNDFFTGNFSGANCNGEEKVNRILQQIKEEKFDKTIAFGDTSGDKPMLNWAHESYFRFFH